MLDTVVSHSAPARQEETVRWLLLVHQLPPSPAYFRVRIRRRLAGVGAVALKNSVYALPDSVDGREDLEWVRREIVEDGGEAALCQATFLDRATGARLREEYDAARETEYAALIEEAEKLSARAETSEQGGEGRESLARLKRKLEEVRARDVFGAPNRSRAEEAFLELERHSSEEVTVREKKGSSYLGRTWVTRRGVKVDRISSAWLIRRFIDPDARFLFVDPAQHDPVEGELRFDMFEGEFTHEGDRCTFETLLARLGLGDDPGLRAIGEIVHDLDLKEERYARSEAPGVASLLNGIVLSEDDDERRIERGGQAFESLYTHFAREKARGIAD